VKILTQRDKDMKVIKIKAKNLNHSNFEKFGTAILKPTKSAPKFGKNWDCWIGLGKLGKIDGSVGVVQTRVSNEIIDSMEAHGKPEFLVPIDEPVIQPVALSNGIHEPDADKVEAFIIYPGQSIVMRENTWHSAAIPLNKDSWYYFVGHSVWDGPGTSHNPWINFKNNSKVKILK
tara:strand:- start:7 stop:531 length:525 start_codon:yes stop_codon:yes gene_type:complete